MIGQLPKEMGGNYTTGVARVVGELSKHKFGNHEVFLYSTNISDERARALCTYKNQYMGYKKRPFHLIFHLLLHPLECLQARKTYRLIENVSFLHMEFIRDNFARVIADTTPDVIHHHGTALSALHYANKRSGIPIIYSPHGIMWMNSECGDIQYMRRLKATRMTLTFADYYTALNESVVKRLCKLGADKEKITVIPNGVDTKKFYYSEEARQELRQTLGLKNDTIVFITVGLVIGRKGQMSFLKLLQRLSIDYQYWIIGRGPDEEIIRQYSQANQITSRVKLIGYVEDKEIYKYHSAADVYALCSSEEAQSLAEIEAYTCGLKTVVNKIIAETVVGKINDEKKRYYVLDFDNVDEPSLKTWLSDKEWKRKPVSNYDWAGIASMYAKHYDEVVQQHK